MVNLLRKAVLAATVLLSALTTVLLSALSGAAAQDQQAKGPQGIEGVWDVRTTSVQCDTGTVISTGRALLMYGPGGRLTSVTTSFLNSTTLGTWRHLRGQSYTATDIHFYSNADGSLGGSAEITREIELSTNANEYTNTATVKVFNTSDQVISTGCATGTATRLFE